MNSFRNVEMAIEYEVKRQYNEFQKTGKTIEGSTKVTRGWDAEGNRTFAQREKEDVSDYRFLPDPDLVPVVLTEAEIEAVRDAIPETPALKRARFQTNLGLSEYDASVIIVQGPGLTQYFESVTTTCGDGKLAANWTTQDVLRDLNATEASVANFPITSEILGTLLKWITDERLTNKSAREVYSLLKDKADSGEISIVDVDALAGEREIVNDTGALEAAITAAIASRPEAVEDVKNGKLQAVGPMMGMVMKQVGGADPKVVREMLIQMIQEL